MGAWALLFIPAWTLDYWQAWVFLAVYFACSLAITLYLMKKDPQLLARRMSGGPMAEKEPAQRIIMVLASLGFIGLIVLLLYFLSKSNFLFPQPAYNPAQQAQREFGVARRITTAQLLRAIARQAKISRMHRIRVYLAFP